MSSLEKRKPKTNNPGARDEWPRKSRKKIDLEEPRMDMTPMIDCTFQLLIFFMVTSKFKTLEGLLATYMPNAGIQPSAAEPPKILPVRVVLRWNPSIDKCKVYVGQFLCNYNDAGLSRARTRIGQIMQTGADTAEIDAGGDVPMHWVIRAVDTAMDAGMKRISFTGAPDPLGDNK